MPEGSSSGGGGIGASVTMLLSILCDLLECVGWLVKTNLEWKAHSGVEVLMRSQYWESIPLNFTFVD